MFDPVSVLVRLLAPDARPDAYNDWRLVLTTGLGPGFQLALVVLVVLALAASWAGLSRVPARRRLLLIGLRALAALIVLVVVGMPAIELRAVSKVRSRVALMVDASRSMGLATRDGTRAERVAQHLDEHAAELSRLAKEAVLEPALFGERVQPMESLPSPLPTEAGRTDLARALQDLAAQSSGRELGAVILYSDGADTEGLSEERARQLATELEVPIYAVGFSPESSAADLAIRRVLADDFAFVHNTVTLDVELERRGLELNETMVSLKKGTEIVATKPARFDAEGKARVSFEFKPNRVGKVSYQVSVPVQAGEVVKTNNQRSVVLKVIRDRIRVLQVAGRPSWDERFLRELLKRNPNVDLISFFILRTPTDLQKASQEELALIPFPVNELFTKELGTFDLVIYQNFTYRPYRMARFLENVQQYVTQGGSFLMIGGNDAFEDGWYAGTPIAHVLPVRLGGAAPWDAAEYRPRLTAEGRRHPVTRIGEPGEPPEAVFSRLPPLAGVNPSLGLTPGAQALLTHPSLPGNPPVVAVREVGQGRTMAVTTDSLWFWRFVAVGEGGAGREFDRFWNSALRWLTRDPELARVRVSTPRSVFPLGEPVTAEIKVLGPDYRGAAGAEVRAELLPMSAEDGATGTDRAVKSGPDGTAVLDFGEVAPGAYVLRAEAFSDGERVGRTDTPVIVEASDVELQAPFPRPSILRALAEASGGAYVDIDDALPTVDIRDPRRVEVDRTRQVPIWDTWPILGLLLLVVGAEWWLRRRAGLL